MRILTSFIVVLLLIQSYSQLAGGYSDINLNNNQPNEGFEAAKALAIKTYPFLNNAKLITAQSQVVAGTNYKLTYENEQKNQYQVIIFSQPWTQTLRMISAKRLS